MTLIASHVRLALSIGFFCVVAALNDGVGFCQDDAPQQTGYLDAGSDAKYFYYLARSRSREPNLDPLILWMTGGPGCSSILALLSENGPCRVDGRNADKGWSLSKNPWSWNEAANVVWVDQPVGVGFSSAGQLVYDEKQVADRMLMFIQNFYAKHEEFLRVPLFIVGESYGGHYVPAVAARVHKYQNDGIGVLAGIAIGNGLVDPLIQFQSKPMMAYTGGVGGSLGHGVISETNYSTMEHSMRACESGIVTCQHDVENHPEHCDIQNMSAETCKCLLGYVECTVGEMMPVMATGLNPYDMRKPCVTSPGSPPGICYDMSSETDFLNDHQTKTLLGVPQSRTWEACNMTTTLPFIVSGDELVSYKNSVIELLAGGVHVLVYAGDTDFMVDWIGCKAWLQKLPWKYQKEWNEARPNEFVLHNRVRGIMQTASNLTFMQVYDSGHMVPMDQPEVALVMIREFMAQATSHKRTNSLRLGSLFDKGKEIKLMAFSSVAVMCVFLVSVAAFGFRVARASKESERSYHLMA